MPEIEVTAMTFGPYAVARLDGLTVMVPNAAPGDRLEVAIASRRRDFSFANIERIISRGPDRRVRHAHILRNVADATGSISTIRRSLRAKAELIAAELRRTNIDVTGEEPRRSRRLHEFGYRSRIRLKVGREASWDFISSAAMRWWRSIAASSHRKSSDCRIRFAAAMWRNLDEIEVVRERRARGHHRDDAQAAFARRKSSARGRCLQQDAVIQGIILRSGREREVIGDPRSPSKSKSGLDLVVDADLFSQVNHAQNRKLVATVMEMAAIERGMRRAGYFLRRGKPEPAGGASRRDRQRHRCG